MNESDKALQGGEVLEGGTETDEGRDGTEVTETWTNKDGTGTDEGTGMDEGTVIVLDQTAVVASIESLRPDLQQATALLEATNTLMSALVFLTLFTWAERKVKAIVMKFTGGRKNASVD